MNINKIEVSFRKNEFKKNLLLNSMQNRGFKQVLNSMQNREFKQVNYWIQNIPTLNDDELKEKLQEVTEHIKKNKSYNVAKPHYFSGTQAEYVGDLMFYKSKLKSEIRKRKLSRFLKGLVSNR